MKKFTNVVCTGCSLACSDLVVEVEDSRVERVWGACSHGVKRIKELPAKRLKSNLSVNELIDKAIDLLRKSRKPLIYGFTSSTIETIKIGLSIAEKLNGVFDSEPSICQLHIPISFEVGLKEVGFEEVLEKSDFIIYAFTNIASTHLRHASKYAVYPRGEYVKSGKESRIVMTINYRMNDTTKIAQHNIKVELGKEVEAIASLKKLLIDEELKASEKLGLTREAALLLLNDFKASTYTSIFVGHHLLSSISAKEAYHEIASLVKEIEERKVATLIPLAEELNSMGVARILYEKYGATHALEFKNGKAESNPTVTSAFSKLMREEFDLALIVGSDLFTCIPLSVAVKLKKIPVIYVGCRKTLISKVANVSIPTLIVGLESGGEIVRSDGVRVELTPFLNPPPSILSEEEILSEILRGL